MSSKWEQWTHTRMTQTSLNETKQLCYFNDRQKDAYHWIREINNQSRAHCMTCQKESGHCGEEGIKVLLETGPHTSGMRQASTSKSIQFFVSPKTPVLSQKQWLLNYLEFTVQKSSQYCLLLIALWNGGKFWNWVNIFWLRRRKWNDLWANEREHFDKFCVGPWCCSTPLIL